MRLISSNDFNELIKKHIGFSDGLGIHLKLQYYYGKVRSQLDVLN